jgi:hypothetical protein
MCSAFLYAVVAASIPNAYFRDRTNYITYAVDSVGIFANYENWLVILFNEPLFLLINGALSYFFHADSVPYVFVFFIAFTLFFVVVKKSKNVLTASVAILLLIFTAQVFHLQLVILRQGIATALFVWLVYYCWQTKKFYFFLPILGLIHSSFFIVTAMFYIDKLTTGYISQRPTIRLAVQFIFGLVVSLLGLYIAAALGMRQASESHILGPVSVGGGNFILWSIVLITLVSLSTRRLYSDPFYIVAMLGLCFYLALYFFSPISGRIVGVFLPFCLVAITSSFSGRVLFIMFFVLIVNFFMFFGAIESNSLTDSGVRYLSSLF